ncbi:hypothetical protein MY5147_007430 [Beauveria neobassiana]|uniref:Uncharacterized protein n=1 Tax=Beauveria bassiana TaxID=176275 RepID=A0A2S7XWJ5_BEABA|nr:hypothetical protein BB8028_0001g03590 [Beauveria bassiana]
MTPKALGLTLLGALQKRQDATCPDFCPFDTMTISIAPTEIVVEQPIRVTGYFPDNGPFTLAPDVVATITGAPGVIDTVLTLESSDYETNTITVCPTQPTDTITTVTTTSEPSTTASCVPAPPVCATVLPVACASLSSTDGLALVPLVPLCTAALGVLGTADTAACLAADIGATTAGASIVACLNAALSGVCITALPQACLDIPTASAADLPGKVAACTLALGPFAVGTAAECLGTAVTDPSNILSCLRTAIGLGDGSDACTTVVPTSDTTAPATSTDTTPPTTVTTPDSTSCVPTATGPAPSVCATGLPQACTELGSLNGLEIIPALVGCTVALGPFAVGNTLSCLATSGITLTTAGTTIVDCLRNALKGECITSLPESCTKLRTETGLALVPEAAKCVVALGPFAVGTTLSCLSTSQITTTSTGVGIIDCLETALGLRSSTSPGGDGTAACTTTSTPPAPTCQVNLPPECSNLRRTNGLALVVEVPICLVALGVFGVGNAAACLATTAITLSTTGVAIVECIENAFKAQCPRELPAACTNLANDNLGELVVDIPLCTVALGPYAAGTALSCLSTSVGSGQTIVQCLKDAFGISG